MHLQENQHKEIDKIRKIKFNKVYLDSSKSNLAENKIKFEINHETD